ncbi:MAG: Ig-like domain-containing protein, partial [Cyanobacteria bacterium J06592_8]
HLHRDADGDTLTAQLVDGPVNGSLDLSEDGSFTYTPEPEFSGEDSFTYTANDGEDDSNVATVTVAVEAPPEPEPEPVPEPEPEPEPEPVPEPEPEPEPVPEPEPEPEPEEPVVSFSTTPELISEAEGTELVMNFSVEGEIPEDGITVNLEGDTAEILQQFLAPDGDGAVQTRVTAEGNLLYRFDTSFEADNDNFANVEGGILDVFALEDGDPAEDNSDPAAAGTGFLSNFSFTITEPTASITLPVLDDLLQEADQTFTYTLVDGVGYEVDGETNSGTFTVTDGVPGGVGPTVGVTAEPTALIEQEQTVLTVNFSTEGEIPSDGLVVQFQGSPRSIAEFDVNATNPRLPEEETVVEGVNVVGGSIVGTDEVAGSLFLRIQEPTVTLTVPVFQDEVFEGVETFDFNLVDGEAYEVDSNASGITLTIDDSPVIIEPTVPEVSLSITPDQVTEESPNNAFTATFTVDGEIPEAEFDADGNYLSGGLSVFLDVKEIDVLGNQFDDFTEDGLTFGPFFDPEQPTITEFILFEETSSISLTMFNDVIEEEPFTFNFELSEDQDGTDYTVNPDANMGSFELIDGNGGPGIGPDVSISTTASELAEGDEFTVNFEVDGDIPEGGLTVLVDSPTPGALGEFFIFDDEGNPAVELEGIDGFPTVGDAGGSSFLVNIVEPEASLTLSVFDDGPNEGTEEVSFDLVNGEVYEVDPDASSFNLTIEEDVPDVPVVNITTDSPVVSEDENPVLNLTLTVDGPIPEGGVPITFAGDFTDLFVPGFLDGNVPTVTDPEDGLIPVANRDPEFDVNLTAPVVTLEATVFDDIIEEEPLTLDLEILGREGTLIGDSVATVTIVDGDSVIPGSGPTVSLSVSDTELEEGDEFTVSFDTEGEIPDGGLQLFLAAGPTALGEFNIFNEDGTPAIELEGINEFPIQGGDEGGFFVTLAENQASITLSVFEDGANEGLETLTFDLLNGEVYEVDSDASSISFTINDFETIGTSNADEIVGDDADNSIDGLLGDDLIAGGLGGDTIVGGEGDDVLRGDANSRASSTGAGGDDIIFGGAGNDRIGGKDGNDLLSGDEGDDEIFGDDGDDTIMGVTGNDILTGDDFSGGSGSDVFVFGNGDGTDTITDFEVGTDFIGLVEGELTFEALEIIEIDGNAAISVMETGETLAVLNGVGSDELTPEMFVVTPDVSSLQDLV